MAKVTPKIVLLREDCVGKAEAAEEVISEVGIKRDTMIEALSVMQTDFEPTDDTIGNTPEGGFFTASLSDAEVRKLQENHLVEEVVEDEMQFAIGPENPRGGVLVNEMVEEIDELVAEDLDEAMLEHDDEELLALEAELTAEAEAAAEEPTAEDVQTALQSESALSEEDIAIEHALLDLTEETAPLDLRLPLDLSQERVVSALRGAIEQFVAQERPIEAFRDEEIEALLMPRLEPTVRPLARDVILPNIRQIYAHIAWRYSRGAGVRLAVVDTGIEPHRDLRIYGGVSFVPGVRSWRDDHGHGTHVAGTAAALLNGSGIVGVAPSARLYAVKVLSRNGSGRLSQIINGLLWCYNRRMHVVNLSLGSRFNSHDPRLYNAAYERAGRLLRRRGILAVAAAGNDSRRPVGNPARCPSYMAVSAIDSRRRFAAFSNIGPQVEVCAPGVQVLSTYPRGYRRLSGTSMASPHVAGAAALAKSRHPTWHGDIIRRRIMTTALDLGRPGRDWFFGYGQVNAYRLAR